MKRLGRRNRQLPSRISVKDSQVRSKLAFIVTLLTTPAEEFNKYLSYVRNLGFEDTPDYDYLRELFTQALKGTGEVEDGEYDWMKIHNGKGWEAMKQHPTAAHLNHAVPNSSQRELHGGRPTKTPIPHDRLNADLPKPGATRAPVGGGGRLPQRRGDGVFTPDPTGQKRQSAQDFRHPEGSTVAQFQHSQQNLQPRNSGIQQQQMQAAHQQTQVTRGPPEEQKVSGWQKIMKVLCCGRFPLLAISNELSLMVKSMIMVSAQLDLRQTSDTLTHPFRIPIQSSYLDRQTRSIPLHLMPLHSFDPAIDIRNSTPCICARYSRSRPSSSASHGHHSSHFEKFYSCYGDIPTIAPTTHLTSFFGVLRRWSRLPKVM